MEFFPSIDFFNWGGASPKRIDAHLGKWIVDKESL